MLDHSLQARLWGREIFNWMLLAPAPAAEPSYKMEPAINCIAIINPVIKVDVFYELMDTPIEKTPCCYRPNDSVKQGVP